MENKEVQQAERKSFNEVTLKGAIVKSEKIEYNNGTKSLYNVNVKVVTLDKEKQQKASYFTVVVPDRLKDKMNGLNPGAEVEIKGFLKNEKSEKDNMIYSRDKIQATDISRNNELPENIRHSTHVKFSGNMVTDFNAGEKLGKFSLAKTTGTGYGDKEKESVMYKNNVVFGASRQDSMKGFKKGEYVVVEGSLNHNEYTSYKTNTKLSTYDIIVNKAQKIDRGIKVEQGQEVKQTTELKADSVEIKKKATPDIAEEVGETQSKGRKR